MVQRQHNKISSAEFYKEKGYAVFKELFSENVCDEIQSTMKYWADNDFSSIMNPDRFEYLIPQGFKNSHIFLTENVDDVIRANKDSKFMREIMSNPTLVNSLEAITGENLVALCSHYFFKEPNTKFAMQSWAPHQDNHWTKNKNNKLLVAHIVIEKTTLMNGCLYLYEESHKENILDVKDENLLGESKNPGRKIEIPSKYKDKKIDCVFNKGDVIVCHGNTIHGSYPNTSEFGRPVFSIHYIAEDEDFISGERARRKVIKVRKK